MQLGLAVSRLHRKLNYCQIGIVKLNVYMPNLTSLTYIIFYIENNHSVIAMLP